MGVRLRELSNTPKGSLRAGDAARALLTSWNCLPGSWTSPPADGAEPPGRGGDIGRGEPGGSERHLPAECQEGDLSSAAAFGWATRSCRCP